jgi:hypothetical protein
MGRFFDRGRRPGVPSAAQPERAAHPPPAKLEEGDLERRLRGLSWPQPTDDVRERCLDEILKRVGTEGPTASGQEAQSA